MKWVPKKQKQWEHDYLDSVLTDKQKEVVNKYNSGLTNKTSNLKSRDLKHRLRKRVWLGGFGFCTSDIEKAKQMAMAESRHYLLRDEPEFKYYILKTNDTIDTIEITKEEYDILFEVSEIKIPKMKKGGDNNDQ